MAAGSGISSKSAAGAPTIYLCLVEQQEQRPALRRERRASKQAARQEELRAAAGGVPVRCILRHTERLLRLALCAAGLLPRTAQGWRGAALWRHSHLLHTFSGLRNGRESCYSCTSGS